ncbi:protein NPAT isoform X4 [Salvelinus alpinus]|uniref:protein NPAT isoform X4 n=1 Tax=Salvelinus alpinus TaxID=8036 RepID=UPI0039FBB5D5
MLLPSDMARLVLGYLQQEGLCNTSQAFIRESPNLKEYAEHSSDDGTIPACVFSLFGKNLTTILNEYVAVKAKETSEETQIPIMMTSLWKKLDFTLNQIKSMQNSPAVSQNQRLRTRNGIVNMRGRQKALSSTQSPSSGFLSSSAPLLAQGIASPIDTPQNILGHSTPVCYSSQLTRPSPICSTSPQIQDGGRLLINVNRESPLQIMVPDNRLTPGALSPGRRKCDSPRRRGGGFSGSGGTGRTNMAASSLTAEPQSEETVTENFPQMVIQNARERILNDKSLQEKLAENINKILASDGSPQSLKASCSTMEPDQSIDEILGLQGEIHMSNDVIQDILEQTESDPAFQALFDLFDYGKSKTSEDTEQGAGNVSNTTTENGETETRCIDGSPETGDSGTGPENSTQGQETTTRATKSSQEPKRSRLVISSPVQPMLQHMVVPVSVVGQNNAGQFSIVPNQLIAMPSPVSAKQPAAVKTKPKLAPKDTTVSDKMGASGLNMITKQIQGQSSESTEQQKVAVGLSPSHRRMLCFDGSASKTSTQTRKTGFSSKAPATATPVSPSVQQLEKERTKLASANSAILGSSRPKRRIETVRCTDNTQTSWTGTETEKSSTDQNQKEAVKKTPSKRDADQNARGQTASTSRFQSAGSSKTDASQSESRKRSQSADQKDDGGTEPKDPQSSRSSSSDHRLRSGSRKEKEETSRQESTEKSPAKEWEGRTEKMTSSQDPPHVTANKENELEGGRREQQPTPAPREFSQAPVGSQTPVHQASSSKTPSKTSPLTKQAAEMLHDIQGLNPPSTPSKRPDMGCPDLPLPLTPGRLQETLDCPRTPARQRLGRDGEGTPRALVPPATPDLPSCSPASEAGSENSINMAAHTLMILSRAAIARTGTPLKDSLRQEGAGTVATVAAKSKKRKQPEPLASPPAKKDLSGSSGSKKKAKKQQKLMDSFPDDLDVDKFLSSLHYDE